MDLGYSEEQYYQALKKLLPSGPAWELEDSSVFMKMLEIASIEFARVDADIVRLIKESDARTANVTLSEWFYQWGIPDNCLKLLPDATTEKYRAVLVSKISSLGSSFGELVQLISNALGYKNVNIKTFKTFKTTSTVDARVYDDRWVNWFMAVTLEKGNIHIFQVSDRSNERLRDWGDELFECLIKSLAPAHCGVIFQYQ